MLGFVHFDRSGIKNERTEILVDADRISSLVRNKYVKITPSNQSPIFFGRIVEGPFFHPEEVSRDSALAQTSILKGESFPSIPNHYAVGGIEILGVLRDGKVTGCNTRPAPQAVVDLLPSILLIIRSMAPDSTPYANRAVRHSLKPSSVFPCCIK
jgi:hypothetical protein